MGLYYATIILFEDIFFYYLKNCSNLRGNFSNYGEKRISRV